MVPGGSERLHQALLLWWFVYKGVWNMPPQNMLLWHVDYFKPKAREKHQTQDS